jgi:hypothetical protein
VLHPPPAAGRSWPGAESNCRHHDFQSCALPTELPGPDQKKTPEPSWRGWEACGENRATGSPLPPTLAGSTYQSRSRNEYSAPISPYDLLNTGNAALGAALLEHSGGRIRTCDLRVMSPTSYQTAPPRNRTEKLADIRRRGQPIYCRAEELDGGGGRSAFGAFFAGRRRRIGRVGQGPIHRVHEQLGRERFLQGVLRSQGFRHV